MHAYRLQLLFLRVLLPRLQVQLLACLKVGKTICFKWGRCARSCFLLERQQSDCSHTVNVIRTVQRDMRWELHLQSGHWNQCWSVGRSDLNTEVGNGPKNSSLCKTCMHTHNMIEGCWFACKVLFVLCVKCSLTLWLYIYTHTHRCIYVSVCVVGFLCFKGAN